MPAGNYVDASVPMLSVRDLKTHFPVGGLLKQLSGKRQVVYALDGVQPGHHAWADPGRHRREWIRQEHLGPDDSAPSEADLGHGRLRGPRISPEWVGKSCDGCGAGCR